jgi:hypothetical protein
LAQLRRVHTQILRGLRHLHTPFRDQLHGLKLELSRKLPSFHHTPPGSIKTPNSVSSKPAAAQMTTYRDEWSYRPAADPKIPADRQPGVGGGVHATQCACLVSLGGMPARRLWPLAPTYALRAAGRAGASQSPAAVAEQTIAELGPDSMLLKHTAIYCIGEFAGGKFLSLYLMTS